MMMMKKVMMMMMMVMMVSWWKSTEWGNLALYPFTAGSFTGTLFFMGGWRHWYVLPADKG